MKRIVISLWVLASLLLPCQAIAVLAPPGVRLPDGFNIGSTGSVSISGAGIYAVAIQPWDGMVLIGGDFTATANASGVSVHNLARLKTDGSLDTSFAPAPDGAVNAIAVAPDKSGIYVGGAFESFGADSYNYHGLAKLAVSGSLVATFTPSTQTDAVVNAILLEAGGIVVGGKFTEMGSSRGNIARISSGGGLSATFATGTDGEVLALAAQPDGMVLAGGTFTTPQQNLARFDATGAHDGAFPATAGDAVRALAVQEDGMILVGGDFSFGTNRSYLARLSGNGEVDLSFTPGVDGYVASIVIQPDGKILIGGDFHTVAETTRSHAARLRPTGAVDSDADPHLDVNPAADDVVNAVALQPDGKFLIAGDFLSVTVAAGTAAALETGAETEVKERTFLARYYRSGALDEDIAIGWNIINSHWSADWTHLSRIYCISTLPSGKMFLSGNFDTVYGQERLAFAGLYPDWALMDNPTSLPFAPVAGTMVPDNTLLFSPQLDDTVLIPPDYYRGMVQLDSDGKTLAISPHTPEITEGTTYTLTMLRKGTKLPNGTVLPDGLMYASGASTGFVFRMDRNGVVDPSFQFPPSLYPPHTASVPWPTVNALHIMPDDKVLIGTSDGTVARLNTDGSIDGGFPVLNVGGWVESVFLEPDGEHIRVFGNFHTDEYTEPDNPEIDGVRIDSHGVVDHSYDISTTIVGLDNQIYGSLMQTDGSLLLYGRFASVNGVPRDAVARILPNGQVDPDFDLGLIDSRGNEVNKIWDVELLEDGKILLTGMFAKVNGDFSTLSVARIANGWATQDLTVSPSGDRITWKRGGSSGELWRVWFEGSDDGVNWTTFLGEGVRTSEHDGWYLDKLQLGGAGKWNTNRWVRARGYLLGQMNTGRTMVESVRLYYLKPPAGKTPITVTVGDISRAYGDPNPTTLTENFTVSPAPLPNGDRITSLKVTSAATAAAKAGESFPVTALSAVFGPGLADNYEITFNPGTLTITKKGATVTPATLHKFYGDDEPALTGTLQGFVASDGISAAYGRAPGFGVGSYAISASLSPPAALVNYEVTYDPAFLFIDPRAASVQPASKVKKYGEQDPTLTGTLSGFIAADGVTATYTRTQGENVTGSPYTIGATLAPAAPLANYNITYNTASFTIDQAPLTVRADNKSKVLGAPLPELTASYEGLAPWDTKDTLGGIPFLSTSADADSPTGSYRIDAGMGSLSSPNYSYSFAEGTLTVTGSSFQSITFDPIRAKTFGDGDFDPGAIASSHLPVGYELLNATGAASVVNGKIRVLAPGTAQIRASQPGDAQYAAADPVTQPLKVNPPPWHALDFDGSGDVMAVDAPQLNFGAKSGYTIEAWLMLSGAQTEGAAILSKGAGGSSWSGYQLILHQDRIAAAIGDGNSSLGLAGTSTLNDGQWHHVALSVNRDAKTASLYLDGRSEAELSNPLLGLNPDNELPLLVGVDRSGTRFFKGRLDELRLWDAPRSQDEIRDSSARIIDPANEPHLVSYFHFDEGDLDADNHAFATAPERTAYGGPGVLSGFALTGNSSNWVSSGAFIPLLETAAVTWNGSRAESGGVVYANYYDATETGLCWNTTGRPTSADHCVRSGSGAGPFPGSISGLAAGATYHIRAYAKNAMGTGYGNEVTLDLPGAKLDQSIDFQLTDRVYGEAGFAPQGRASSGLPVSYASSNSNVAVIEDGWISIRGAGSADISAAQEGDDHYNPAPGVTRTLFVAKAPLTVSADHKVRAYHSANPPLTFSMRGFVRGEGGSAVSGSPLLSTSAAVESPVGDYPITVSLGTLAAVNYSFILSDGTLTVVKSCQDIVFPPLGERTYGDPPSEIAAYTCSGLGVAFASSDPGVVRVDGNVMTITGAGSAVITASQRGNGNVDGGSGVARALLVHKSWQGVSFPELPQKEVGDAPFALAAASSSGLPVSYRSSDQSVAVVSGSTATIVGPGIAVITAQQEGSANYDAALPASRPLTVAGEGGAPLLSLSTLSSGASTADPVLNVAGSAADPSGIASLTVNGVDLTASAGLFSSAVPLCVGKNSVTVTARDGAGNKTTRIVEVTLDPLAPSITVAQPADNSVTDSSFFTATGTVTPGSALSLAVNGGAPQSLEVTGGSFSGNGYLREGLNTLELAAELSGRSARVKRSVTFAPGKPYLAITEPAEDLRTEQESLTLRGVAGAQGSAISVLVEVGGASVSFEGGSFEKEVALSRLGQTRITASVTDRSGNSSFTQRNVVKVERVSGDLNGDGVVDIRDVLLALRLSLEADPVTPQALAHGDVAPLVDGVPQPDGKIDVGDVLVLLRKVVGLVEF